MRMSPSCQCCHCQTCRIAVDEFNRADGTDIGADWDEVAGNWEILDGQLSTTASQARAVYDLAHPAGVPAHVVTVKLLGEDPGDELGVLIAVEDASNYLLARVRLESPGQCGSVTLYAVVGGVATQLHEVAVPGLVADTWHTLRVCYVWPPEEYEGTLAAVITTADGTKRALSTPVGSPGLRIGLATGSVTTRVRFDDFCWQRHRSVTSLGAYLAPEPHCPDCSLSGCRYSYDAFDRADSTDLGCLWEEQAGAWEIVSQELKATAVGRLQHTAPHPDNAATMWAMTRIKLADAGDKARVYVAGNGNTHLAAEFEAGESCGWLRLFRVTGGVDAQLGVDIPVAGLVPDEWHQVRVCYGLAVQADAVRTSVLTAYVEAHSGATQAIRHYGQLVTPPATNIFAGLAVAAATDVVFFDDYELHFTYDADRHPNCPDCDYHRACLWGGNGLYQSCEWEEVSGTWDGVTTMSAGAFFKYQIANPFQSLHQKLEMTVSGSANGTEILGYICWKNASTYLAARVTLSNTCGKVEIIQNGTVLDSLNVEPLLIDETHFLCVSYDGTYLRADLAPGADHRDTAASSLYRHLRAPVTADPDGMYFGVGTGNNSGSASIAVAAFTSYSNLYRQCSTCDTCWLSDTHTTDVTLSCEWNISSGTVAPADRGVTISSLNGYAGYKGNDGGNHAFVAMLLRGTVDNQTLRVYINDDGALTGPWVEVDFRDSPAISYLRLSSGETKAVSVQPNTSHVLFICLNGSTLTANLDASPSFVYASLTGTVAPATGKHLVCQLRGAAGAAHFTSVLYARKYVERLITASEAEQVQCGVCYADCNCCPNNVGPVEILVELEDLTCQPLLWSPPGAGPSCCSVCEEIETAFVVPARSPCAGSLQIGPTLPNQCQWLGEPFCAVTRVNIDWRIWCSGAFTLLAPCPPLTLPAGTLRLIASIRVLDCEGGAIPNAAYEKIFVSDPLDRDDFDCLTFTRVRLSEWCEFVLSPTNTYNRRCLGGVVYLSAV